MLSAINSFSNLGEFGLLDEQSTKLYDLQGGYLNIEERANFQTIF